MWKVKSGVLLAEQGPLMFLACTDRHIERFYRPAYVPSTAVGTTLRLPATGAGHGTTDCSWCTRGDNHRRFATGKERRASSVVGSMMDRVIISLDGCCSEGVIPCHRP